MARKTTKPPLKFIAGGSILLLVLIIGLFFIFSNNSKENKIVIPSTNPLETNQSDSSNSSNTGSVNSSKSTSQTSSAATAASSTQPPVTPYGQFVSNHHPGGGAPTSEASVCNTSAGAICYIQFTKGSETKKLDPRTTNGEGAAIWYWDVNSAGLSAGTWSVSAVATLNNQTKTASDPMALVVQQ